MDILERSIKLKVDDDIFKGVGIEVELYESDDFLKIKETLTRIGVSSKKEQTLYQSCHILHKQGRYVIVHFKELFYLDGKPSTLTDDDLARRNTVTKLLSDWELLKVLEPKKLEKFAPISEIKIIPYKEKSDWNLVAKYNIGNKKKT